MDPTKRGNPPFEPSSYAAGMERRLKRQERWIRRAEAAAKWMLDGTPHEKQFAERWWRDHFNQPEVVLSDPFTHAEVQLRAYDTARAEEDSTS